METHGEKSRLSCSEAILLFEKTIVEEVLSTEEQETMDGHLTECGRCRNLVRLTSGLSCFAEEPDENKIEEAISAVSAGLNRERQTELNRKGRWKTVAALSAALSAVAASLLIGGWLLGIFRQAPEVPSTASSCIPSSPVEAALGVFMIHCNADAAKVISTNEEVRVTLKEGAVGLSVDPNRPNKQKVIVETPLGEVRVKGTLFAVRVEQDDTKVEVFRGVVEVVPQAKGDLAFQVKAGFGVEVKERRTFPLRDSSDAMQKALRAVATSDEPEQTPSGSEGNQGVSASISSTQSEAVDTTAESEPEPRRGADRVADRGFKRPAASMDVLIQDAQSCMLVHDWECAASRYEEVLKGYSGHPESAAVLISLAKIELRHLNLPNKALEHFKTYEQNAAMGPLLEEALLGEADAYRRLGRQDREVETLRKFLGQFPESSLSGKAKTRLKQLTQ